MRVSILRMLVYDDVYFKAVSANNNQAEFSTITDVRFLCRNK